MKAGALTLLAVLLNLIYSNAQTGPDQFYVFVGEKISVVEDKSVADTARAVFDYAFTCKYRILQQVYGYYQSDTITFKAYDHYGIPVFARYQQVLMFIAEKEGRLYNEKYQYFPLYQTKSGRWASPYSASEYTDEYNKGTKIKPENVGFVKSVVDTVDFSRWTNKEAIKIHFPSPYYKIRGNIVTAIWGNYVEQLFELKRRGILRHRGIYLAD